MTDDVRPQEGSAYAEAWDGYVSSFQRRGDPDAPWPGDEWGAAAYWREIHESFFVPAGVREWRRAVEIGPGSGKYTLQVLGDSAATIRAYDVSERYLDVCRERCAAEIEAGRLSLHLLGVQPDDILRDLRECGWVRRVDGFYSIDAMVHVDLQFLVAYLLTAATTLAPGGRVVMSVADATADQGFEKLLADLQIYYWLQGRPSHKFEWLSPDLIRSVLERLGFELEELAHPNQRDIHFVAKLVRPERGDAYEHYLESPRPEE